MDPETSPVSMPCDVVMNAILDALAPLGVTDCQCRARRARLARDPRARMMRFGPLVQGAIGPSPHFGNRRRYPPFGWRRRRRRPRSSGQILVDVK